MALCNLCSLRPFSYAYEPSIVCVYAIFLIASFDAAQRNGTMADQFDLDQGVQQGSSLGAGEFTEYSSPVFSVINQHRKLRHAYAGNHQVYCSFHPDSMNSDYGTVHQ